MGTKKNVRIRFNAEPHHIHEADGKTIYGGGEDTIDQDIALTLAHSTWANVEILDEKAPRWPSTPGALDQVAKELGVTWPEPADGQAELSVTEKQAALDNAIPQQPASPAADETAATADGENTPTDQSGNAS